MSLNLKNALRWLGSLLSSKGSGSAAGKTAGKPSAQKTGKKGPGPSAGTGTVKFFNRSKGFGFICDDNGSEIYVHISGLVSRIRENDKVSFEVTETKKGLTAVNVTVIGSQKKKPDAGKARKGRGRASQPKVDRAAGQEKSKRTKSDS